MKNKVFQKITALAVLSIALCLSAEAAKPAGENKKLVFGGNSDLPPYSFIENNAPAGYTVDLVKILAATINRNIEIRLMPAEECLDKLRNGKISGIIGLPVKPKHNGYLAYSEPVAKLEFGIFVDYSNTYVNSMKSLEGTLVAVNKDSPLKERFMQDNRIQLILTDTVYEGLKKLENREVTAFICESNVASYYIQKYGFRGIKLVAPPVDKAYDYSLAISHKNHELLSVVNKGIGTLRANGTIGKLKRKWFSLRLAGPFPWKMVVLMTSGITLLMLILAGILWVISLNATVKAKTRQIQLMSQKMVEKDKLAVLGKLAGQIAHELRTPLSIINNSVYLLRKEGSENRDLFEKRLRVLENKIKLSSNILESILSYSRVKAHVARTVSIKECVDEVLKDVETPEGIKATVKYDKEDELMVFMDFHQLYSVIRNLVLNAYQAMGETGSLDIHAFPSPDGSVVNIRLCDAGPGIAQSAQNKIFNLFYSTKITGTGLGLPISKSIIEANDGRLYLEDTGKEGSCFVIQLPSSRPLKK
ncbi:MAG: transporter substrate-binding domain-containing protein [Candidatus Omnitrophica bacterium]|nr:transporter substrate-binding domain-containing protein [Candidatus Omnitrophota bacterium]